MVGVKIVKYSYFKIFTYTAHVGAQIRLVNGSSELDGKIEIFCNGKWHALCQINLDNSVSNQICRGLGFSDKSKLTNSVSNIYY